MTGAASLLSVYSLLQMHSYMQSYFSNTRRAKLSWWILAPLLNLILPLDVSAALVVVQRVAEAKLAANTDIVRWRPVINYS